MTRLTVFLLLIVLNVVLVGIGWLAFGAGMPELLIVASLPVSWLLLLVHTAGASVVAGGGLLQAPNVLGIALLIVGTLISLWAYYALASWIYSSFFDNQQK